MKKGDARRQEQPHTQKLWLLKLEKGVKTEMMIGTMR